MWMWVYFTKVHQLVLSKVTCTVIQKVAPSRSEFFGLGAEKFDSRKSPCDLYLCGVCGPGERRLDGRCGDQIPVGARFSAPVQTGPGAQPVPYAMGYGSLSREWSGRSVALTTHPHLVPRLKKENFHSGPSWPVLGLNLPLVLPYLCGAVFELLPVHNPSVHAWRLSCPSSASPRLCQIIPHTRLRDLYIRLMTH
jgi:hypothetical protein